MPSSKTSVSVPAVDWIAPLARPYLKGYAPRIVARGALRGVWFFPDHASGSRDAGFFIGFLTAAKTHEFLAPVPPECLAFASVAPGSLLHRKLVLPPGSLLRKTHTYIRWLTHRPPRFELHEDQLITLVRHAPMCNWPGRRWKHYARNFFIETLCWLVRSGLVARLREASASAGSPSASERSPRQAQQVSKRGG